MAQNADSAENSIYGADEDLDGDLHNNNNGKVELASLARPQNSHPNRINT